MKINGERHYLWRAVDHEGEVLESYVTKKRDKKAALKFMKKAMRRYGSPNEIVTDKLGSYGAAARELVLATLNADLTEAHQILNVRGLAILMFVTKCLD